MCSLFVMHTHENIALTWYVCVGIHNENNVIETGCCILFHHLLMGMPVTRK